MPNFQGLVEIEGAAGTTISLDVTVGGNGQTGNLVVADGTGAQRVAIDGQTGTITSSAADGTTVARIDGQEGDVVVHRTIGGTSREVLRFDASTAALYVGADGSESSWTCSISSPAQ